MTAGPLDWTLHGHEIAGDEYPDIEASSDEYALRFRGSVGAWLLSLQAHYTLELLGDFAPPLRILDVGGGHGQLVPHLVEAGHQVTALGTHPICAERLQPWLQSEQCSFVHGSLTNLPFADGEFDVAISYRTLPHMNSWRVLIAELCRVSRRGVLVDFPSTRSVNVAAEVLFSLKLRVEGNTRRFLSFDPREVSDVFVEQGFCVSALRSQFLLPMALHRLLGSATISKMLEAPGAWLGLTQAYGSPIIARAERL